MYDRMSTHRKNWILVALFSASFNFLFSSNSLASSAFNAALQAGIGGYANMASLGVYAGQAQTPYVTMLPSYGMGGFNAGMYGWMGGGAYGQYYGYCPWMPMNGAWPMGGMYAGYYDNRMYGHGCSPSCHTYERSRRTYDSGGGGKRPGPDRPTEPRPSPVAPAPVVPPPTTPVVVDLPPVFEPPAIPEPEPQPVKPDPKPFVPPPPKPVAGEPSIDAPNIAPAPIDYSKVPGDLITEVKAPEPDLDCSNRRSKAQGCQECYDNFVKERMSVDVPSDLLKNLLPSSAIATAAENVMATVYQDCSVLMKDVLLCPQDILAGINTDRSKKDVKRVRTDIAKLIASHPYLSSRCKKNDKPSFPVCENPPIFNYGGKPTCGAGECISIAKNPVRELNPLRLKYGTNFDGPGLDCSGFLTSSLLAAGLRIYPSGHAEMDRFIYNSEGFSKLSNDPKSCFGAAQDQYDGSLSISRGDVFAMPSHVFIVESAGPDPFGVKNWKNCSGDEYTAKNLDFRIIQSMPHNGGIGVSRLEAKHFIEPLKLNAAAIKEEAVKACKARKGERPQRTNGAGLTILRHKGSAACKMEPYKIKYSEAVKECMGRVP